MNNRKHSEKPCAKLCNKHLKSLPWSNFVVVKRCFEGYQSDMGGFVSAFIRVFIAVILLILLLWHAHALFVNDVNNWHLRTLFVVPMWSRVVMAILTTIFVASGASGNWRYLKFTLIFLYLAQFQSYSIDYSGKETLVVRSRPFPYLFERVIVCDELARWSFLLGQADGIKFPRLNSPIFVDGQYCSKPRMRYVFSIPYLINFEPYPEAREEYDRFGIWLDDQLNLKRGLENVENFE